MKQVFTLLLLVSIQCYSQEYVKQTAFSAEKPLDETFDVTAKSNDNYTPGKIKDVPSPAIKHFKSNFPGATDVTVLLDGKISTLSFAHDGKTVIIKYKEDGTPVFIRKTYSG